MPPIYVDADACPVKDEVYRVAKRYDLEVFVVANQGMQTPEQGRVTFVRVDDGFDAADDWIAERATTGDVVVTSDIPLAARCIERGAHALDSKGKEFKESTIGSALASREMLAELREMGLDSGGPKAFEPRDRSRFLGKLDEILQRIKRAG